jgi:lactoylglutathione lyase
MPAIAIFVGGEEILRSEGGGPGKCAARACLKDVPPAFDSTCPTFRRVRTLHTAYRVADLAVSLDFYLSLGYEEVGRISVGDGASLTVLKFPDEEVVTLELVHRPADGPVQVGNGFSHLAVQVDALGAAIEMLSQRGLEPGPEQRPAGPRGPRTSWLSDPDGYRIELVEWPPGHADGISSADFR